MLNKMRTTAAKYIIQAALPTIDLRILTQQQ